MSREVGVLVWLAALGCGVVSAVGSPPGELWFKLEDKEEDGDRVTLTFPATSLRSEGEPAMLETEKGEVDLRPVARKLKVGDERQWTMENGATAVLWHAPRAEGTASEVSVGITGPRGKGLTLSVPIDAEQIEGARKKAQVNMDVGLPVSYDAEGCAQLRRSPPMPLVEIVGPKGNGLRIATK